MTEVDRLYPLDGTGRDFDAKVGAHQMAGRLALVMIKTSPNTVVYYDRSFPLDGNFAIKRGGSVEEIADDSRATELTVSAIDTTRQ